LRCAKRSRCTSPIRRGPERDPTSEEQVDASLESRLTSLRAVWDAYQRGDEDGDEDHGTFDEYALAFDYVEAGTFGDQREGFFRYQISTGGPGEEFRFFADAGRSVHRVEFWRLDWFDGACRVLAGDDLALLMGVWEFFAEVGSVEHLISEGA